MPYRVSLRGGSGPTSKRPGRSSVGCARAVWLNPNITLEGWDETTSVAYDRPNCGTN